MLNIGIAIGIALVLLTHSYLLLTISQKNAELEQKVHKLARRLEPKRPAPRPRPAGKSAGQERERTSRGRKP
ncbi:hypothetical protein NRIC_35800 [Enterococcus florum]|uniref:Uncharacterized protein n=1 Tax=Enterococcus florum TaxID=2480627 RepID=A0A4V0WQ06_9ENTE|nr:hypothetical protein [Enterococcus florum]GCF95689.1 hypothetical protein NRIC_35800 [Enterococcus florum]